MRDHWPYELWRYKELFYFFAWRDMKIRYKQTLLGVAWAVLQPLLTMVLFTLLFGRLVQIPSDGLPYPVFYYTALLPWLYFSGTVVQSGNSLIGNAQLLTKVYFPRVVLPASPAIAGLVDFLIGSLVLIGMMAYYRVSPTWKLMLWPTLLLPLFLLSLGVGMLLSVLNVRYRDVKYVIPFLLQLWLFATPIIYPASLVPERFWFFMSLNPLSGLIDAFRATFVPERPLDWSALGVSTGVATVLFLVSALYFKRAERDFADIV